MARFRYRMQSILNIKVQLESQAKQEFGAARMALDKEEEILAALQKRREEYVLAASGLLRGELKVRDIIENKEAILRMDDFIKEQQIQVNRAAQVLERARLRLQSAMQERKMQEKLRERAFVTFLDEEKHREGKEVDELTSYTYGQRIVNAQ